MKWNVRKLSREKVSVLGRESEMKHAREKSVGERTSKVKNYRHSSDRCLTDKCKLLTSQNPTHPPYYQLLHSRTLLSTASSGGIKTLRNEKVTALHRNNQESQSLPFQYLIKVASRIFSDI